MPASAAEGFEAAGSPPQQLMQHARSRAPHSFVVEVEEEDGAFAHAIAIHRRPPLFAKRSRLREVAQWHPKHAIDFARARLQHKGFGDVTNDEVRGLTDLNAREFGLMAVLAIATLWMGVYPKPFTDVMHVSVTELLKHAAMSKLVGG